MLLPLFLALQQGAAPAPRLEVHPAAPMVAAGDTVRLTGRVLGADGKPVEGSRVRFAIAGASFEGAIDTAGLVTAGAVGRIPVSAIGVVPGRAPIFQRLEVEVVPGPAARVAIEPARERLHLVAGQTLDLAAAAYSAAGDRRADRIAWSSARPSVAAVSADGRVTARSAGRTTISARVGDGASAALDVEVLSARLGTLVVAPATAHARQGDVVRFSLAARDAAGRAIEGLAPTWSIAPGKGVIDAEGNFVGYEPGEYTVTASLAGRSASARVSLAPRDVRRTATVVGRAPIPGVATSEVWVHPNGKVAYLGTVLGHDKFYALDISDPARPVVTDSVGGSMRSVNDLMSTPDGKYLVYTREGAADRKNGIGIASLEDPLHPKEIALFTEGVTSGVHSAFVHHQEKHGTHVYVTNDGTGAMHVVDINDPRNPKGIATWRTERADAGRMLHDIDVQ
ncbi:MAG TPA: Ig-like domain-containing protein, partial [Gemmatimonadaceae bacterium]